MIIKLYCNGGGTAAPVRKHKTDAGADVCAPTADTIPAHGSLCYDLGFGVEIPEGFMGLIFPRSGLASKGIGMDLPPIDANYTGNIHAVLVNHTDVPYQIEAGARIGQLVIVPVLTPDLEFMDTEYEDNAKQIIAKSGERGANGLGSTGV